MIDIDVFARLLRLDERRGVADAALDEGGMALRTGLEAPRGSELPRPERGPACEARDSRGARGGRWTWARPCARSRPRSLA
jgi:hypothetical protein